MSNLYEEDILLGSEHQAELLRRLAAGEPVNERPDRANIIEESRAWDANKCMRLNRCCSGPCCIC